jgi:hypothetical protein
MAVDRRKLLTGGAAVLVLVLAAWRLWPSPPQAVPAPPRANTAARSKSGPAADSLGPMAPVKLGALNDSRDAPGEAARNPFRFQARVVAPPPRPAVTQPAIEAPRVAPIPSGPPPAPPIPLKLIGVLERANGVKWAVLTDGKSGPMYGKDGDIIDGRYAIVKIGTESVEITYTDGRGRQVIRLTGQ